MNELFLQLHLKVNPQHMLLQLKWILIQNYWTVPYNFDLFNVLNLIQQHSKVVWIHSILHHQESSFPSEVFWIPSLKTLWETTGFYPSFIYLLLLLLIVILKWCCQLLWYKVYLDHQLDQLREYSFFFIQMRTQFIYELWTPMYRIQVSFDLDLIFTLHLHHWCTHLNCSIQVQHYHLLNAHRCSSLCVFEKDLIQDTLLQDIHCLKLKRQQDHYSLQNQLK